VAIDYESRTPLAVDTSVRRSTVILIRVFMVLPIGVAIAGLRFFAPTILTGTTLGDRVEAAYITLLFLGFGYTFGMFFTTPYRLRFYEQGVWQLSWRGARFVPWTDIRRASLSRARRMIDLNLFMGGVRWIRIPLTDYQYDAKVFRAIESRLPVPVAHAEYYMQFLSDPPVQR
jgi:hypothetical protein